MRLVISDQGKKEGIIWSADNAEEHSFEMKTRRATEDDPDPPSVTHTIYTYYRDRYGITLRFPKVKKI